MGIQKISYSNHEEWLSIRNKYIGGSDAGAVVGLDDYKSPYSLWAEKTGRIPAFGGNITTSVGAYLEEFVAKMFSDQTDKKVRKCNFTLINDMYPFACANVDRIISGEDAILEIKTTNSIPVMRKCKNGEYPERWYCQMTHYLAVTGAHKAYLAVLIKCEEFKIFELERDDEEINALMSAEAEFWKHVENDTPPDIDGSEATSDTLATLFPVATDGEPINLSSNQNMIDNYMDLKKQQKELQHAIDNCANIIKQQLGESEKGITEKYNVTWANSARKTFDTSRFAKDYSNLDLSKYYKTTNYRTFTIKERE